MSVSFRLPLERRTGFMDPEGNLCFEKRQDEITKVSLDWASMLAGDPISSVAYEDHGTTRTNTSNTGDSTTTFVTGSGYFIVTLTLTSGEKIERVVRFIATDGDNLNDYRG